MGTELDNAEKELQIRIASAREELQKLILDRDSLKSELSKVVEQLNSRREKLRKLKEEIANVRTELNRIYGELNNTKSYLKELKEKFRSSLNQLRSLSSELKKFGSFAHGMSIDEIREEIEKLEWILVTTPNLDLEEERRIIDRISQLEKKLRDISMRQRNMSSVYSQYEELSITLEDVKKELKTKSEELNRIRERIAQLKELRDRLKQDIASHINDIVELKKKREELRSKITEINSSIKSKSEEYRSLIKELNKLKELREQSRKDSVLSRKREEIKNKIERGERVTLYDLYIAFSEEEQKKVKNK